MAKTTETNKPSQPFMVHVEWPISNGSPIAKVIQEIFLMICSQYSPMYTKVHMIHTDNINFVELSVKIRTLEEATIYHSKNLGKNTLRLTFIISESEPTN